MLSSDDASHRDISPDCNAERLIHASRKMKRTTTEILIEVEETVAVRMTEKSLNTEIKSDQLTNEYMACPFCGQPILNIEELKQEKNENRNDDK